MEERVHSSQGSATDVEKTGTSRLPVPRREAAEEDTIAVDAVVVVVVEAVEEEEAKAEEEEVARTEGVVESRKTKLLPKQVNRRRGPKMVAKRCGAAGVDIGLGATELTRPKTIQAETLPTIKPQRTLLETSGSSKTNKKGLPIQEIRLRTRTLMGSAV
jgi:hypothetical protein